jgi:hypothetical protein
MKELRSAFIRVQVNKREGVHFDERLVNGRIILQ